MLTLSPPPTPDEIAILRSVLYAALFEYPLRLIEVHRTLIESRQSLADIAATYTTSEFLQSHLDFQQGFLFPRGHGHWIEERRVREVRSRTFVAAHTRMLQAFCAVPFVSLLAISGSLAHLNGDRDPDLDLFIVTKGSRVWSVTLAIVVLAKLLGCRRIVCANFVVADTRLAIEQQDLFSANQIIHLRPLVGADVYCRFLRANPFVRRYYPNFDREEARAFPFSPNAAAARVKSALEWLFSGPSAIVEAGCRRAYGWHLRRRIGRWQSPDQVRLEPDYLKLHTQSHRQEILRRFERSVGAALATILPGRRSGASRGSSSLRAG